ncbi:hypothetical protein [uncultured Pseudomonas sp.]|uniref:hypothetical protein n=1 Tax=uncultured Pseudomonas sp. TaxID=114707 RepID=UPI0025E66024|nr:hypothetical protein [uncultured Pseudomonas sp.]
MFINKARHVLPSILLTLATLQGCASIAGDSSYPVAVSSTPPGANFEVADKRGTVLHEGQTPAVVVLPSSDGYFKGQTYSFTFRREGFADHRVELDSTISGWYWGNILLGGVIGMLIVDPLTGAMYKLPQDVTVELEGQRRPHASAAASADLSIASIEDLTPAQRERLIPLH